MMVSTKEQLESLRCALERRTPQELAAFILTLIHVPNGVGSLIHAFAVIDDSNEATEIVKNEIVSLLAGERDYEYRHKQSSMIVSRLGHILDAIEIVLLPKNPTAAIEMLVQLIEGDANVAEQCFEDDFGAQQAFGRACDLLRSAARNLPIAAVQPILDRLRSRDDYGLRSRLSVDA